MKKSTARVLAGVGFAALTYGVSALGAVVMRRGHKGSPESPWYRALRKPSYQPPNWLFAPVWTAMYGAMAFSGYRVFRAPPSRERTAALGLWATQLALNGMWTPLFFGAHRPELALTDMAALDATVVAYLATAATVDPTAAAVLVPYLGWLGFATALNGSIVANNPRALLDA